VVLGVLGGSAWCWTFRWQCMVGYFMLAMCGVCSFRWQCVVLGLLGGNPFRWYSLGGCGRTGSAAAPVSAAHRGHASRGVFAFDMQ